MPKFGEMRLFAIGDIHGCYAALLALDAELGFGEQDCVITLGLCGSWTRLAASSSSTDRAIETLTLSSHCWGIMKPCCLEREKTSSSSRLDGCRGRCDAQILSRAYFGLDPTRHAISGSCHRFHVAERDFFVHANADARCRWQNIGHMLFGNRSASPPAHCSGAADLRAYRATERGDRSTSACGMNDTLAYGNGG